MPLPIYLILRVFSDWDCRGQADPRSSVAPVGHWLLFAVGAWPPHDGVRRARRLNLTRDLRGVAALRLRTLNEIASPIVPTGTTRPPRGRKGTFRMRPKFSCSELAALNP